MRIYYPDDDDGDALRAREMYGAVIERGTVVWQDIGAVSAPRAHAPYQCSQPEDQGTVERAALALAKRAELA